MLSITINLLLATHVIVSLLIILAVLMQRPKNEGLGAAFGGGMTENLFGAQTTNVLANFTRWLGGIFFVLSLTLSVLYARESHQNSAIKQKLLSAPVPEASPAVTPAATKPAATKPAADDASPGSKGEATPVASPKSTDSSAPEAPAPAATP
jgi:preprotein translocase subunit SecG